MMANPIVHALAFAAAVVIPGGLLVYFAWRALSRRAISDPDNTPATSGPSPAVARAAFELRFPKESLRARNRRRKLYRAQVLRHRNFKK